MESLKRHTTGSDFDVAHLGKLPKVGIVYSYSNVEADVMIPFLNNGYQGIIHAGVGNGNIHQKFVSDVGKGPSARYFGSAFQPCSYRTDHIGCRGG